MTVVRSLARHRRVLGSVAILVALALAVVVLGNYGDAGAIGADRHGRTAVAAEHPAAVVPSAPPLSRSVPVSLRIPAIALDQHLIQLGRNPDRTVQVPSDFQRAGWYNGGPTPGEDGSAVILGHVDSYQGPAVFFRLNELTPGDEITVGREDGSVATFVVTDVETYRKDQFPAQQVYGPRGGSSLQLVTCGGEFDTSTRSYESNVVVYSSLTQ